MLQNVFSYERMSEQAEEIFTALDNGAHIYFCGLKGMMPGIQVHMCVCTHARTHAHAHAHTHTHTHTHIYFCGLKGMMPGIQVLCVFVLFLRLCRLPSVFLVWPPGHDGRQ